MLGCCDYLFIWINCIRSIVWLIRDSNTIKMWLFFTKVLWRHHVSLGISDCFINIELVCKQFHDKIQTIVIVFAWNFHHVYGDKMLINYFVNGVIIWSAFKWSRQYVSVVILNGSRDYVSFHSTTFIDLSYVDDTITIKVVSLL